MPLFPASLLSSFLRAVRAGTDGRIHAGPRNAERGRQGDVAGKTMAFGDWRARHSLLNKLRRTVFTHENHSCQIIRQLANMKTADSKCRKA
jgi:hypothetical protein